MLGVADVCIDLFSYACLPHKHPSATVKLSTLYFRLLLAKQLSLTCMEMKTRKFEVVNFLLKQNLIELFIFIPILNKP